MVDLSPPFPSIQQRVEQILDVGYLSRKDYLQLVTLMLSDSLITDEERSEINRIFDELQAAHLKLIK